jgi:WD40 repeat protein
LQKCRKYIKTNNIIKLLNKYIERKNIDEKDIQWAYSISKKYEPSFELIIPYFNPDDYIPLFTYKDLDGEFIYGIKLSEINANIYWGSDTFFQKVYEIKNNENIIECINKIFEIFFNIFKDKAKLNDFESEFLNYKEKQNYYLIKKVKNIARDVTLSKVDVKLDPMNSYERKLIHEALQGFKYITTESEGEEPNRCIVVKYREPSKDEVEIEEENEE